MTVLELTSCLPQVPVMEPDLEEGSRKLHRIRRGIIIWCPHYIYSSPICPTRQHPHEVAWETHDHYTSSTCAGIGRRLRPDLCLAHIAPKVRGVSVPASRYGLSHVSREIQDGETAAHLGGRRSQLRNDMYRSVNAVKGPRVREWGAKRSLEGSSQLVG